MTNNSRLHLSQGYDIRGLRSVSAKKNQDYKNMRAFHPEKKGKVNDG